MNYLSKWRCRVCETFNDLNSSTCVVCEFKKGIGRDIKKEEPYKVIKKCNFKGCESIAVENQQYCQYHAFTVCPICSETLKSSGMDYCIDCGLALVEKSTSGLRKWSIAFRIIDVAMAGTLIFLLLSYIFYFN